MLGGEEEGEERGGGKDVVGEKEAGEKTGLSKEDMHNPEVSVDVDVEEENSQLKEGIEDSDVRKMDRGKEADISVHNKLGGKRLVMPFLLKNKKQRTRTTQIYNIDFDIR